MRRLHHPQIRFPARLRPLFRVLVRANQAAAHRVPAVALVSVACQENRPGKCLGEARTKTLTARQTARERLEVQTHWPLLILLWKLPNSLQKIPHLVIPNRACKGRNLPFLGISTKRIPRVVRNGLSDTFSAAYYGVTVSSLPLYFTVLSAASVRPPPTP